MSERAFAGQTAIVTGASKGLGRAIALAFAAEGANVVLTGRTSAPLAGLADEVRKLGGEPLVVPGDVAVTADWAALVHTVLARFPRIDVLVNNAGILGGAAALCKIAEEEFDEVYATNVRGTWLGMKHCIPPMIAAGGGAIVNLSSIHGLHGNAGQAAYSASKHAVIGLTRTAAIE